MHHETKINGIKILNVVILLFSLSSFSQNQKLIDTALDQLGLDKEACKLELATSKVKPNNPNETILVIPEIVEESECFLHLNGHVLVVETTTGKIIQQYVETKNTSEWYSNAVRIDEISIDTAPYKLTDGKRGFGVRVTYTGSSKVNPYNQETLSLYIHDGKSLRQVLKNYSAYDYGGESDGNCEGEFVEYKKIFLISEQKNDGYYNIIVKNTTTRTKTHLDHNNECIHNKTKTKNSKILKYDKVYSSYY